MSRAASVLRFLRQVVEALGDPLGREYIVYALHRALWPVVRPVATVWRIVALRRVAIVAVVGSFGKTTTTRSIQAALGIPVSPFPGGCTHSYLARDLFRIRPWQRWAVLEVGIEAPGEMRPMARMVRPNVTVVTSIGSEHITSMKTLEVTRREKSEMVAALKRGGVAILNGDDPNVVWMAGRADGRVATFGRSADSDVVLLEPTLDWPRGMRFRIRVDGGERDVVAGLFGRHWGIAIAAAIATARELGVAPADAARRLARLRPTIARLEPIRLAGGAWVIRDDCKSAPETVSAALDLLEEIPATRKIAVIGEITEVRGPQGVAVRAVGRRVAEVATSAVFAGSRKHCQRLVAGASAGGLADASIRRAFRSAEAVHAALPENLGEGDVILVKGSTRERLERVVHLLLGESVRCTIPMCVAAVRCDRCPKLATGWLPGERPPIPDVDGPSRHRR